MNNQWDERYGKNEYFYGTEPNTFLVETASLMPSGSEVLCLAEGEGRNAVYLAKLGYKVTAVDFSEVGLKKLQSLADKAGVAVKTVCSDLNDFKFEKEKWGGVVSIWCHLPLAMRAIIHKKVIESLQPGGVFILEAYTPEQLKYKTGGPQNPDMMPTLEQLEKELPTLEALHKKELIRHVSEGLGHEGQSAVVQFVGKK